MSEGQGGKGSNMNEEDIKRRGLIFTGYHLPYNPKLIDRAKILRKNMTPAEKKLWYGFLKVYHNRFRPQRVIDNYIVDFYCSSLKLVIEIDGEQHYTDEGKTYDKERDAVLESYGLKVCRIMNNEIIDDFELVCKKIERFEVQ